MGSHDKEYADVDFDTIEAETARAILFAIEDKKYWVPRSLIESINKDENVVIIEEWFATKGGLT